VQNRKRATARRTALSFTAWAAGDGQLPPPEQEDRHDVDEDEADESMTATWIAVLAGIAMIGMSAMTDYEGAFLAHAIPMRMHLLADMAVGAFLVISPWLFGFADQGANAWLPFVVIGLGEIGAAATTDPVPAHGARRHEAHGAV
jgi:hypothetical protein